LKSFDSHSTYTTENNATNCNLHSAVGKLTPKDRVAKFLQKSHHPHITDRNISLSQQFLHNKHPLDPVCSLPDNTCYKETSTNLSQFLPNYNILTNQFNLLSNSTSSSQLLNTKHSSTSSISSLNHPNMFPNSIGNISVHDSGLAEGSRTNQRLLNRWNHVSSFKHSILFFRHIFGKHVQYHDSTIQPLDSITLESYCIYKRAEVAHDILSIHSPSSPNLRSSPSKLADFDFRTPDVAGIAWKVKMKSPRSLGAALIMMTMVSIFYRTLEHLRKVLLSARVLSFVFWLYFNKPTTCTLQQTVAVLTGVFTPISHISESTQIRVPKSSDALIPEAFSSKLNQDYWLLVWIVNGIDKAEFNS
jgi:hypothetical protein